MITTKIEPATYSLPMNNNAQEGHSSSSSSNPPLPPLPQQTPAPLQIGPPVKAKRKSSTAASTHGFANNLDSKMAFKKARARPTLSCTECVPCCTCIQRGVPEKCRIEELEDYAPPQPFALASEQAQMKLKIQELEERLASVENAGVGGERLAVRTTVPLASLDYSQIPAGGIEPDAPGGAEDNDEQAAFALETLALDGRNGRVVRVSSCFDE
ncbi:hypothetical protein BT69DRAFT_359621 [Atractiella rhizophila]|nr:hypothetical protein BT69DRAFT_359621 [Atractiella rhizophila]